MSNRLPKAFRVVSACIVFLLAACSPESEKEKELAFAELFGAVPASVKIAVYRGDHQALGRGGAYVLVFESPKDELLRLVKENGYVATDINSDPGTWRVSLCNEVLEELSITTVRVDDSFECYSKSSITNRSRIFFSPQQGLAVFLGYGSYAGLRDLKDREGGANSSHPRDQTEDQIGESSSIKN